jgi:hypothetical protein
MFYLINECGLTKLLPKGQRPKLVWLGHACLREATSASGYPLTRCHIGEQWNCQLYRCENLKTRK